MSREKLDQFRHTILQDEARTQALAAHTDEGEFTAHLVGMGQKAGFAFRAEDVQAALRSPWNAPPLCRLEAEGGATLPPGWLPTRLKQRLGRLVLDWLYVGSQRLTEPFFEDTLAACRVRPFARLFRVETPPEALDGWETRPGLPLAGLIFHLSRCGSTLIAQMLAALPQNVVISEAALIDTVLSASFHDPTIPNTHRISWLRGAVHALGQQRYPQAKRLFLKLDCWHISALPLILRAFPGVPWVFISRDPVEVMVSHARRRGRQMVPGLIEPGWVDIEADALAWMGMDEYCARVLAHLCRAAIEHHALGRGRLVAYSELPEVVCPSLTSFFGLTPPPEEIQAMRNAAQFHAKRPQEWFENDTRSKQDDATEAIRRLAAEWVAPHYARLETLRQQQGTHR